MLGSFSLNPAGTSSILAGAALAALQRAAGRAVGTEALIHAVLHLEQVLTTGM